jgi:amidohydrolase
MNDLKEQIRNLSSEYFEEIRGIRRHFHQHPELSCQEFKTAEFICNKLDEYGITYVKGVAETGIVGMINGQDPESGNVALRADMDALPINEENAVVYKSQMPSKMHACGHDVHMASLLGTAKILTHVKGQFKGSVKLIFQPSEETYPGGAIRMIREGVLKNPEPLSVFGQHVINTIDVGKIGMKAGPYMASTDEVYLTIKGKGGHAATPEQVVDPILIASHIVVALQQIVSRNANPIIPTVLSFGKISGEGRTNIIPDKVTLEGTIRTYDELWRKSIHEKITHMASSIASGMGGTCEVRIAHGYPYLDNDVLLTSSVREWCVDYLGEKNVIDLDARMTSEDFSYFADEIPSCFYRLGIRNEEKGIISNLHTSKFDVDEQSLETGMGVMAWIAINRLNQ